MRKLSRLLIGLVVAGVVISVMLLSASIYTFARLTAETVIAEVRFERAAPDRYLAYLSTGDFCSESVFAIEGDQWRIDAEFVKWHYWANLLGLDSQYRLDRFEGRYSDVERQNRLSGNAHDLAPPRTLDLLRLADSLGAMNFLVDATYGSSTYQDIEPDRLYAVIKSPTGIFTRSRPASPPRDGDVLAVQVRQACGEAPGAWERMTAWVDQAARTLL
jgi:hypothetical protein